MVNHYPVGTFQVGFFKNMLSASYYPEENYWQYKTLLA